MMKKGFPMWNRINLEIYSYCNRDCEFCPRSNNHSGTRKDENGNKVIKKMPTKKVYDIIDEVVELGYNGSLGFHRLSEPLLDLRYIKFARYAKSKGLKIIQNTNGDILRKNLELCSELDGLVDGFVIGLYDYKTNKQRRRDKEFWKKRFKKTKITFSDPVFPVIRQGAKIYFRKSHKILDLPCFRVGKKLLIRYDGNVSLCCEDDTCTFNLGNIFEAPIKDIWWSKKHINIIDELKKPKGRYKFKLCSNCFIPSPSTHTTLIDYIINKTKEILSFGS